jgi:hypothetical protein
MPESENEPRVLANIPFLFYDVIGRTFPGGFFLLGSVLSLWRLRPIRDAFACLLTGARVSELSAGAATVVIGTSLLVFAIISTFLGFFVLSPLSNLLVEKLWNLCRPLTLKGMSEFLGTDNLKFLQTQFKIQFGSEPSDESLNRSSFLCAYFIWKVNPGLGVMEGRYDADLLAAQSTVLASLVLFVGTLIERCRLGPDPFLKLWLVVLGAILVGSFLAFEYHRKKRVYGRFGMFLALSNSPHEQPSPSKK